MKKRLIIKRQQSHHKKNVLEKSLAVIRKKSNDLVFWGILLFLVIFTIAFVQTKFNPLTINGGIFPPSPSPVIRPTSIPTTIPTNVIIPTDLVCTDCFLFPVDKNHPLAASYKPTVEANGLVGGGSNTADTKIHLKNFIDAAKAEGFSPVIASAYRSYSTQQTTFNYWVQQEQNNGYSKSVAIERANVYSAKAGYSEHQLGTVVDIAAEGCSAFDTSCNANLKFWQFIETDAYKYGFVVSYPNGKQALTGYKSEPWHIRYIGVDLATQLFQLDYLNPNNQVYSSRFLLEHILRSQI